MADCIFCKIVKGEIPSTKVYEGEKVIAFEDVNPQAPHHYLVIPKEHLVYVTDMTDAHNDMMAEMFRAVNRITEEKGIQGPGFRLVINKGDNGGQAVDHLHMHILGGRRMEWPPG